MNAEAFRGVHLLRPIAAGVLTGALIAFSLLERSGASTRAAYEVVPIDMANVGGVSGIVRFASGERPQDTFPVNRDREVCGPEMRSLDWVRTADDRLLDVIVFIDDVLAGKPFTAPSETTTLNQKGCRFAPEVRILQDGGTLVLTNSDPILHNAQAYELIQSARRKIFSVVQEAYAEPFVTPVRITRGNVIKIECSAHEFMQSWLFVARNPYYAQVDGRGAFRLGELPPGQYRVRAWHPRLGFREATATVVPRHDVEVVFDF
ncbi:carboxypeptidase regulatory-like domain-containing protein [Bradyrhizobium barranii]